MVSEGHVGPQFSRYTVVSAHQKLGAKRPTIKRTGFDTAEDADEHARAVTPWTDGSMLPNLPDSVIAAHEKKGLEYSRGHHSGSNRYSVTFLDPRQGSKYRDG